MRIKVKSDQVKLWIPIPLCLGGAIIRIGGSVSRSKALQNNSGKQIKEISKEQQKEILKMYKQIKKLGKKYKGLKVLEVVSSDGDEITITL